MSRVRWSRCRLWAFGFGLIGTAWMLVSEEAHAQVPGVGRVPSGSVPEFEPGAVGGAASSRNPFANPYANPYLNPYYGAWSNAPEVGLLYLLNAQREGGGIGSGRIGGSKVAVADPIVPEPRTGPTAFRPGVFAGPTTGVERYYGRGLHQTRGASGYFGRATPRR